MTADDARKRLRPYVEKAKSFTGWDFSQIRTRELSPELPWSYVDRARELVSQAKSVLDIGTGGGERFVAICEGFEGRGIATEAWPPNTSVAYRTLHPFGINLIQCEDEHLPFASTSFDVVLNRHSAWNAEDVARILKPGGVFLTQQVSANNWRELRSYFPRRQFDFGRTLDGELAA